MQDESPIMRAMAFKGHVDLEDLEAELAQLEGEPMPKRRSEPRKPPKQHEGRANLMVEVQVDGAVFLSFRDHETKAAATVRIDPANVGAVTSMLMLAADKEVDSCCYVEGGIEVARV